MEIQKYELLIHQVADDIDLYSSLYFEVAHKNN